MNDDDDFLTFIVLIGVAAVFGPALAAHFIPTFAETLVHWHLLVTDGVLIPVAAGAGLDLARVVIAAGILVSLALVAVVAASRAAARRKARA